MSDERDEPRPSPDLARVEVVFHRLLDVEPERRESLLDALCGDDAELRAEVLELIDIDQSADKTADDQLSGAVKAAAFAALSSSAGSGAASSDRLTTEGSPERLAPWQVDSDGPPTRLGPYRVLDKIGEGGLATVYVGERSDDEFQMRVAIKVVKRGMDTVEVLRRLRLERQILAQLDHPNIARLLDGGTSTDGRPFVVMELIEGDPVTHFCDRHQLDIEARLGLFLKICQAVQAAHRSLIIHRDLKPSNILVAAGGEPKLLDFGIAKLLDKAVAADMTVAHTATGMRWLTPDYASPEQVLGQPLTTAVDVWALGVLLYQLTTGQLPFIFESRTPRDVERVICETAPPRPSQRVERATSQIALARRSTVERLGRRLRGDLDKIIAKAMHREPERRYGSVTELADDIERHLSSRPVLAHGDSALYRSKKFLRRYRGTVAATGLVFATLVAGIVATNIERHRAERTVERLEAVVGFTSGMFQQADPNVAADVELTVRDALGMEARRIESSLSSEPDLAAMLLGLLGGLYRNLGDFEASQGIYEKSVALYEEAPGDYRTEAAAARRDLASALLDRGRVEEALALLESAVVEQRALLGDDHLEVAHTLHFMANAHVQRQDYETAEPLYRQALTLRHAALGDSVQVAETLNELGTLLYDTERLDAAQDFFERALHMARQSTRERHAEVAKALHNLAAVAGERRQLDRSEQLFRQIIDVRTALLGDRHRDVGHSYHNLAFVIDQQGRHAEAVEWYEKAIDIVGETASEHTDFVFMLEHYGITLMRLERRDEALQVFEEAVALREQHKEETMLGRSLYFLSWAELESQRVTEARSHLQRSVTILRAAFDAGDPRRSNAELLWAAALATPAAGERDCAHAQRLLADARAVLENLPPDRPQHLWAARVEAGC